MQTHKRILGTLLLLAVLSGCAGQPVTQAPVANESIDLVSGLQAYAQSDSEESLLAAIRLLEGFAAAHPDDYASRARLANAYTLLGAVYRWEVAAKEAAYTAALRYAEAAMLTVPGFAHVRETRGVAFQFALQQLDHRHLEAMEFWKAALLYDYEENSGTMGKMMRYGQLNRAVSVMDRLDQIDENANWGSNRLSRALYLYAMPEYVGGDEARAERLIAAAIADNPNSIVLRWARAKYVSLPAGDRALFMQDLQWVVKQPLHDLVGYRPWNLAIQRNARYLLKNSQQRFK